MEQLFLFEGFSPDVVFINENGIDVSAIPPLNFLSKDISKPSKQRTAKTEKMKRISLLEKGKFIIFPSESITLTDPFPIRISFSLSIKISLAAISNSSASRFKQNKNKLSKEIIISFWLFLISMNDSYGAENKNDSYGHPNSGL